MADHLSLADRRTRLSAELARPGVSHMRADAIRAELGALEPRSAARLSQAEALRAAWPELFQEPSYG